MIYKGNINTLYVKDFQVTDKGVSITLDSVVIAKDSLFYRNFAGKMISFEYNTYLPTYTEAEHFVHSSANPKTGGAPCVYVNYNSLEKCPEERRSVKELKKVFKAQRKGRTNR